MNAQTMTRVLLVCWCGVLSGVGTAWAQYAPESDTPPPPIRDGGTEVPARYYPDRTAQLNGPPGTSPVVAPAPTFGAPPAPLPAYDNPQPAYPIAAPGPVPRSPSDAIGAPLSEPVAAPTGPPVNFAAAPSIPRWVVGVDALWLERSIGD
ncbi:MAG: hypothetical protein K8T25_24265, partial [Planctomycetia bacterium]|nr:hypothetical protein [Planctomycetia bacterium]